VDPDVAETGQPYAYTEDNPVNGVDPLGLSWYDPSWAHKVVNREIRGAKKVRHFAATHKKDVITAAVIIATIPLDETGAGEAIDAEVLATDAASDGAADVAEDVISDAAQDETEGATEAESATEPESSPADPTCGGQSFTASTQVRLANGESIPLAQVKVGDMVLATNTLTGQTQAEPVTALLVNDDSDLMDVSVKTSSGTSIIKSTQHHLFWDLTTGAWTQAENLNAGTALQTPTGATATVVSTTVVPGAANMWDLTVDNDHDFYVAVSSESPTAVLVHNCPGIGDIHGDLNAESRGIDVENARANGDRAYQVEAGETRSVSILNNGNGTNDIVIDRLGAQAGDSPITSLRLSDGEVASRFGSGLWQWELGG
jgi:hypothetical protein